MRRPILRDPLARSALWSRNLAVFALVVAALGIVLSHKGLDARDALSIEAGALALAALALLFALFAMAVIWVQGRRGLGLALVGLLLPAALFAYPAWIARLHRDAPTLRDITTDASDPPSFLETVPALAARDGWRPPATPDAADVALQAKLYPDLQTLDLDADVADVEAALQKLVRRRRWTIVGQVEPKNFATGHLDMVVKPGLMGFPADVTVRLRALGARTRVDLRAVSRSRYQEDPGAVAARVRALSSDLEAAIGES